MLTTLSTIGFGDLHPRNDPERIMNIFIFFIGISIFTNMMGIFNNLISSY